MESRIYFDNSATTPLDPAVRTAMLPFLDAIFGNPSSLYQEGRLAKQLLEESRQEVANLLNAQAQEIVFTASGTEADNLALIGVLANINNKGAKAHVITSAIEHPAVLETCHYLEQQGTAISYVKPNSAGIIEPNEVAKALRPSTKLVSIMAANNVVGTLQPISELAAIAHQKGALFHTDAVQAAGKIPFDVVEQQLDLVSLSAHKLNGPKGIGALYVRNGISLSPIIFGGGQERGLRSATENMASIAGFGCAAKLCRTAAATEVARLVNLREQLWEGLQASIPQAQLIGDRYQRLPGHLCLALPGHEGEAIKVLLALDEQGISISSGSACSAHHAGEPSHVLSAMGFDPIRARGSLRITLGRFNTAAEVQRFLEIFPATVKNLRTLVSRN